MIQVTFRVAADAGLCYMPRPMTMRSFGRSAFGLTRESLLSEATVTLQGLCFDHAPLSDQL
jgi:hypothetical protein